MGSMSDRVRVQGLSVWVEFEEEASSDLASALDGSFHVHGAEDGTLAKLVWVDEQARADDESSVMPVDRQRISRVWQVNL